MGVLKRVPVLSQDLLEDTPVPRGCCYHRVAPSGGDMIVTMKRLYHASSAASTPHQSSLGYPHPTHLSWSHRGLWDWENAFSFYVAAVVKPSSIFFFRAFAGRCVTRPRAVGQRSLAPRPRVSNAIPPVRVQHYHDRLTCSHCRDARDNLSLTMGKRERSPPVSDG